MDSTQTLTNIGVRIQLTPSSAVYLFLALALSCVAFFVAKRYI